MEAGLRPNFFKSYSRNLWLMSDVMRFSSGTPPMAIVFCFVYVLPVLFGAKFENSTKIIRQSRRQKNLQNIRECVAHTCSFFGE
jgi:hypothetical protein